VPLENFFIRYGVQDRAPGEFVESDARSAPGPRNADPHRQAFQALRQRYLRGVRRLRLTIAGGIVTQARIAFGGMAGIPARAPQAETALTGQPWNEATSRRRPRHWRAIMRRSAICADRRPIASPSPPICCAGCGSSRPSGEPMSVLELADG
jgi:xanthine dehydrogenase iron-sulfur cluster and FAD-binding subunit A